MVAVCPAGMPSCWLVIVNVYSLSKLPVMTIWAVVVLPAIVQTEIDRGRGAGFLHVALCAIAPGNRAGVRLHRLIRIRVGALLHLDGVVLRTGRNLPKPGLACRELGGGDRKRTDGQKNQNRANSASRFSVHELVRQ